MLLICLVTRSEKLTTPLIHNMNFYPVLNLMTITCRFSQVRNLRMTNKELILQFYRICCKFSRS